MAGDYSSASVTTASAPSDLDLGHAVVAEFRATLDALDFATNAFDELSLKCHGLSNDINPLEPADDVPAPTLGDVGALGVLVARLRGQIETLLVWVDQFEKLHESAGLPRHLNGLEGQGIAGSPGPPARTVRRQPQ